MMFNAAVPFDPALAVHLWHEIYFRKWECRSLGQGILPTCSFDCDPTDRNGGYVKACPDT